MSSLSYNNMNMFNMYGNNGFGSILQQGMNMLGGSYGMGSTNFFTNCYGEVNYDKMAGFQVANALLGTTFQAIAANKAEKASEPQINYTKELNAVAKELQSKETELGEKKADLATLTDDKKENEDKLSKVNKNLDTAKETLRKAESALKEAKSDDPKYEELNEAVTDAKNKVEELTTEKEKLSKKIEQQEKDIETKTKECNALEKEIDEIKEKQDALQSAANDAAEKDAKSCAWQRSKKEVLNDWQGQNNENTKIASKRDLERASYEYRSGSKTIGDKRKAATAFVNMYKSNESEFKNKYGALYTSVQAWLDKNPENKVS